LPAAQKQVSSSFLKKRTKKFLVDWRGADRQWFSRRESGVGKALSDDAGSGKLAFVFCFLVLAGCAPKLPLPDTRMQVTNYLPASAAAQNYPQTPGPLPSDWWRDFGNDGLNTLVATALENSPSIAERLADVRQAEQNAAAATGAYLPQIGLNPSLSRQSYPTGPNGFPPYTIYDVTGTISYDPGLFGARAATFANGAALSAYARAQAAAARQTLAGNVVAAAIAEAGYQAQIDTTNQIIGHEQRLLTLLNGEYADGAIPQLNVLQQQSVILTTEATVPPLQTELERARDQLAVLTGALPADFTDPAIPLAGFTLPDTVPVALPSAYLANRPDLAAARALVAAQNATLALAVAHLYPDLTLSAQGGYAAETIGTLFEPGAALWTLAGNLLAPLYDGGVLHARRQAAQAQLAAALAAYRGAVLTAFGDAADALQAIQNDQTEYQRAEDASRTATSAVKLASQQFSLGAIDYTTVLTSQATATQAALVLVQAKATLLLDLSRLRMIMAD
jgi:NodT family efflux transporter outer membrane factor (OMF) lipoprotein